jgi:predicted secreted protein
MQQLTSKTFLKARLGLMVLSLSSLTCEVRGADKALNLVKQGEDGLVELDAAAAKIQGPNARLEGGEVKDIMWWTSMDTFLRWAAKVQKPGHYRVEISYAIIGNNNGNPLAIWVGDQMVKAIPKAGNGFDDYKTGKAGEVTISKPGDLQVLVKPLEKAHEYVINIRRVSLIPAEMPTDAIDIGGGAIKQFADGSFKLTAGDADISGMNAALETDGEKNIGFWSDVGTSLIWSIHVETPGKYRVELNYSLMDSYEGSKVAVSVGDQTIKAKPQPTKAWTDYQTGNAGQVTISKSGDIPVVVKPISNPLGFVMNLRSVTLLPAETPTEAIEIHDKPITQAADGSLKLTATNAEIDGQACRLEGGEKKYIVWRNSPEGIIKWAVKIDKPGTFNIQPTYSLATSTSTRQVQIDDEGQKTTVTLSPTVSNSSKVSITVAGQTMAGTLKAGSGWDDFKAEKLGSVTVSQGGNFEVILSSPEPLGTLVMHLQAVSLVPVGNEASEVEDD